MTRRWIMIADIFMKDGPEYDYAESYLTELRSNWRENEKAITRTAGLIVGLSVVFELIFNNRSTAITFLSIKLSNTDIIQFGLPVMIAYLYYAIVYSFAESEIFSLTHDAVIRILHPTLANVRGQYLLYPSNSLVGSAERVANLGQDESQYSWIGSITGYIRPAALVYAPPLFVITAYEAYSGHSVEVQANYG